MAVLENGPEGEAAPEQNPLAHLPGLMNALQLMDAAVAQNIYKPQLLQYKNMQQPPAPQITTVTTEPSGSIASTSLSRRTTVQDSKSRLPSRAPSRNASKAPSRTLSRMPSESGSVNSPSVIHRSMSGMSATNALDDLTMDLLDLGYEGPPSMQLLWEWKCPLGEGLSACSASWNKARPDLLAVGYGNFTIDSESSKLSNGLVAFFSIKNPEYPLWMFETSGAVTALDFSHHTPNMLALGMFNGTVAIYDVKMRQGVPAMQSEAGSGKHSDPVWKIRWVDRGADRDEGLVSISTDGRVTQWSTSKGLEFVDLMKLKRVTRKPQAETQLLSTTAKSTTAIAAAAAAAAAGGASQQDAFISRLTSGMSFDFSTKDDRMYLAGTEDGWIHKCSTSYSEQYLESYAGHMGPVYQVQWSPFKPSMFVSCSGDWTMRLWEEGREHALLSFQSGNAEVNDVQWCPTNSTVFGAVSSAGKLEIWDFSLSTVKPVATQRTSNSKLTFLLFAPKSPVVICGGEGGTVSVFRMFNVEREYDSLEEQLERLNEAIVSNVMKSQPGQAAS